MKDIWSDHSLVSAWLDIEIALAKVQARLGIIPFEAAEQIRLKPTFINST